MLKPLGVFVMTRGAVFEAQKLSERACIEEGGFKKKSWQSEIRCNCKCEFKTLKLEI